VTNNIDIPEREIERFCRRHHIRRLSLFGSVLRDDFRLDSDVDVLIEFDENQHVGLMAFAAMQAELSSILGRQVHLSTPGFISESIRDHVIQSAQVQYERS
jgi:predicted nucleotidyltransferase